MTAGGVEHGLLAKPLVPRMLDREKIVAVLMRRFPGSTPEQIAPAANALVGLEDEWMEIPLPGGGEGTLCRQGCYLTEMLNSRDVRLFSRSHRH